MNSLRKYSTAKILVFGGILLALALLLSLCVGAVALSPAAIWEAAVGDHSSAAARILLHVRLPRTIAALFGGAGLAGAGVILQSVLANPLASPNIIGVNAGAGLFAVLVCWLLPGVAGAVPAGAFIGALLAVLLISFIARKTGASKITIVLAGVAVNSFLGAGSDLIYTLSPDAVIGGTTFKIGGLAAVSMNILVPACAMIAAALLLAFFLHNELDILSLGDATAKTLGLAVKPFRFLLLVTAACLAGASVSFAGLIGFVGLIVPHVARFFVGSESGRLLPVSAVFGATLLLLCDVLARVVLAPFELPVGIILAFLGAPFFIFLLVRQRGGKQGD